MIEEDKNLEEEIVDNRWKDLDDSNTNLLFHYLLFYKFILYEFLIFWKLFCKSHQKMESKYKRNVKLNETPLRMTSFSY